MREEDDERRKTAGRTDAKDALVSSFAANDTMHSASTVSGSSPYEPSPAPRKASGPFPGPAASLLLGRLESNRYAVPDDLLPVDDLMPVDEEEEAMAQREEEEENEEAIGEETFLPRRAASSPREPNAEKNETPLPSRRLSLRRATSIQTRDDALPSARTFLFAGASAEHPLSVDHDEEVHVDDTRLVWTSGGVTRFRATFEERAKQIAWCFFPEETSCFASRERRRARRRASRFAQLIILDDDDVRVRSRSSQGRETDLDDSRNASDSDSDSESDSESDDSADVETLACSSPNGESFDWFRGAADAPTLCVRLRRSLFAHAPGGETRTAPLPRDALGDFAPCALGLLMRTRRGIFALRHPLDEPAPVSSVFGADADFTASVNAPSTPSPAECVAWSSADSLYFLTHDPTRKSHALWRVAPAPSERRNAADAPFAGPVEADELHAASAATPSSTALDSSPSFADTSDDSPSTSPARVAVERVWTEPEGFSARPTSFAGVAHDDDARLTPRLCVLGDDGVLRGYAFGKKKGKAALDGSAPPRVVFTHDNAKTATCVKATRAPLYDLLFVTEDGGMALACGARVAIAWRADTPLFGDSPRLTKKSYDFRPAGDEDETNGSSRRLGTHTPRRVGDITRLHSPVGARVTAELTDGGPELRLVLPGAPVSPATRALMEALGGDCVFGDDAKLGEASRAEAMEIVLSAAAEAASPEDEWDRAQTSLLAWCGCESLAEPLAERAEEESAPLAPLAGDEGRRKPDRGDGDDAPSSSDDDDDDAWEYLLRSERHASDAARYPSMAAAASRENDGGASERKTKTPAGVLSASERTPRSERSAPRLSAAHAARAAALLRAAHAAYEACKLDVLRRPCLVPLRGVCVRAATACASQFSAAEGSYGVAAEAAAFLDHHARDAWFDDAFALSDEKADDESASGRSHGIDLATARLAASALAKAGTWAASALDGVADAPDVCAALEDLFSGTAGETRWLALVPPLVRGEMVPIRGVALERVEAGPEAMETDKSRTTTKSKSKRSSRAAGPAVRWAALCVSFAAGAAASARAAARGDREAARGLAAATAEAMVSAGFGLAELARVPSGLALRLRDCLRRCRERPPPRWPPRAYALVGRDDLAAAAVGGAGAARSFRRLGFSVAAPLRRRRCAATGASCLAASPSLGALDPRARLVPGDGDDAASLSGAASRSRDGGVSPDAGDARDETYGDDLFALDGDFRDDASFSGGGSSNAFADASPSEDGVVGDVSTHGGSENVFDGMAHLERFVGPLLFGRDRRLREARALLASATPASIALGSVDSATGEGGDPEVVVAQQARLWSLAPRTAALAIGRGAFTLGTARARRTETLRVPPLTLAGRLPAQRGAVVALDLQAAGAAGADFARWPEFHNGVAAGLALSSNAGRGELTRAWIMFNRPKEPQNAHAGVLFALGLTGHLNVLTNTDLYRYLVQEHDATTVAALLGVAAARRGSARADAAKMCFLHLPAIHPAAFPEVELTLNAQSAALAAVGLLYQGTAHRRTCEIALAEIGRDPSGSHSGGSSSNGEGGAHAFGGREGYALAAGFALGLTALGRGADAVGLADLRVVQRLRSYLGAGAGAGDGAFGAASRADSYASHAAGRGGVSPESGDALGSGAARDGPVNDVDLLSSDVGGGADGWSAEDPDPTRSFFDDERDALLGGRGGGVDGIDGDGRGDGDGDGRGNGGARGGAGGHAVSANGQTMRGAAVNVDAASPGAALALGLMFLRTGDAAAAASLDLPSTHYALDHVRPDFVLTRVVAKALIMWHEVEPSVSWMETRLPPLLRPPLFRIRGSAFFDEARFGSGGSVETSPKLGTCFDAFPADDGSDREALAQAHVHALAGACMALGLRFAGTADAAARDALRKMLSRFLALKAAAAAGEPCGELVDRPTAETCVCVAATALACVMAGTGDVETFRVLRRLRMRVDTGGANQGGASATAGGAAAAAAAAATGGSGGVSGLSYGAHAAIASAVGFLFLGGGTMTFSTDNASVAALWMATYPRFPQNASDNRCHLQAFRHLYALAARKRMLRAVDAKSGVDVTAPVEMRVRSGLPRSRSFRRTRNDEARRDEDSDSENITVVIRKTPCLLPDPDMLVSVAVAGDRYWPVSCDDAESLLRLYKTRTLPVQRLAGALPYAADPTGARAGAAASLDVVRARAALEPPRSVETTWNGNGNGNENEAFEFATRASDKARARRSKRHGASDADSFGAFVSDPASVGFRRLMCDFVAEETLRKTTTSSSSSSFHEDDETTVLRTRVGGERSRLASFCQSALRECAAREEPDAASAYVELYAASIAVRVAVDRARKTRKEGSNTEPTSSTTVALVPREPESAKLARVLALADVKLLSCSFGDFEKDDDFEKENDATPSKEAPIMPRLLVSSFLETARDALDAMRFDAPRGELAAYYGAGASGAFDDSGGERKRRAGLFGAYLRFFRFPPAFAVRRALAKFGLGPPGSGLDPEAVAVALAVGLPGTEPAAALRVARCGL